MSAIPVPERSICILLPYLSAIEPQIGDTRAKVRDEAE
jgi:hypothetical protein